MKLRVINLLIAAMMVGAPSIATAGQTTEALADKVKKEAATALANIGVFRNTAYATRRMVARRNVPLMRAGLKQVNQYRDLAIAGREAVQTAYIALLTHLKRTADTRLAAGQRYREAKTLHDKMERAFRRALEEDVALIGDVTRAVCAEDAGSKECVQMKKVLRGAKRTLKSDPAA